MDINLNLETNETLRVFINGKLAGEISVCQLSQIKDLEAEVTMARRLERLPHFLKMVVNHLIKEQNLWEEGKTKEACKVQFTHGLIDGLQRKMEPYPGKQTERDLRHKFPDIRPVSDSRTYNCGYDIGEAIAKMLEIT